MANRTDLPEPTLTTSQVSGRLSAVGVDLWQVQREHAIERRRLELAAGDPNRALAEIEFQQFKATNGLSAAS